MPSNWVSSSNSIEVIGGGGAGGLTRYGGGGGGGAYSKITNVALTPGSTVLYRVGAGGINGAAGGDTFFGSSGVGALVLAKGGKGGTIGYTGGLGGSASQGVGTTKYSGGNGATNPARNVGAGSGGGAAGPNGNGLNATHPRFDSEADIPGRGGHGDAGRGGLGGNCGLRTLMQTIPYPPFNLYSYPGCPGREWDANHGSGGGGLGFGFGGNGGRYGGGGAARAFDTWEIPGNGAQGIIVLTYDAPVTVSCTVNVSPTTINSFQTAQLSWTSTNAEWLDIAGLGPVRPADILAGSTIVGPSQTTTYTGTAGRGGPGGPQVVCSGNYTLTVTAPPTVTTKPAINITQTGTRFEGAANPKGTATNAWFRYSTTNPGSGNDTSGIRTPSVPLGAQASDVDYAQNITGLLPNTIYYYWAVAQNTSGQQAFGIVRALRTLVTPPPVCIASCKCVGNTIECVSNLCEVTQTQCTAPAYCDSGPPPLCRYPAIPKSLVVVPPLIRYGGTVAVRWSYPTAQSCTITGNNGDSWTGIISSGEQSRPITGETTYTAQCDDLDPDLISDDFVEFVIVKIIPNIYEI